MIVLPQGLLARIRREAVSAYPSECCGLLVGCLGVAGERIVTRVVASPNVTEGNTRDSFEVAPEMRFALMRELDGGTEHLVGHYHSHPDHPPTPSERDLSMAYEPELVWVITSVMGGRAAGTTAHVLDARALGRGERRFVEIRMQTDANGEAGEVDA